MGNYADDGLGNIDGVDTNYFRYGNSVSMAKFQSPFVAGRSPRPSRCDHRLFVVT